MTLTPRGPILQPRTVVAKCTPTRHCMLVFPGKRTELSTKSKKLPLGGSAKRVHNRRGWFGGLPATGASSLERIWAIGSTSENCTVTSWNRHHVPATFLGPHDGGGPKLRKRKSLALASTFSRIAGSGSMRAISTAPIIVEKIAKKARSLSRVRRPGMNGSIWPL